MLNNEQMAVWCGFRSAEYDIFPCPSHWDKDGQIPLWKYPDKHWGKLPNFINSMDACNKWIVPKLREKYGIYKIDFLYSNTVIGISFYSDKMSTDVFLVSFLERTEALAFCAALSKLVEVK